MRGGFARGQFESVIMAFFFLCQGDINGLNFSTLVNNSQMPFQGLFCYICSYRN